ncbi:MAG: DUF6612 family protein [Candidatus Nezhaarchaeales archaeon]
MKAKVVVPIVVVIVAVIACVVFLCMPMPTTVNAQEVVNNAIAALKGVNSCSMVINMTMTIEVQGQKMDVGMDMYGLVDYADREMYIDMSMSMSGLPQTPQAVPGRMEIYILRNQTMYVALYMPGEEARWIKSYIPDEEWNRMFTPINTSFTELAQASQLKYVGTETVSGVECYVIEFKPTPEELAEYVQSIMGPQAPQTGMPYNISQIIKEGLKEFTVKMWISKNDYTVRKQDISMKLSMTIMGVTANMDMKMLALMNWNIPVEVELPPEAQQAIEVPSTF